MPIKIRPNRNVSPWRRLAVHSWGEAGDPSIYGMIELPMTPLQEYLDDARARTGERITLTHLIAKALAYGLEQCPEANGLVVGKRLYLRDEINIFLMVDIEGGKDLSGVVLERVNEKSLVALARELRERSGKMKRNEDEELAKTKSMLGKLPDFFLSFLFNRFMPWWIFRLRGSSKLFGMKNADPFGGAWITNVATFGLPCGFAPLIKFSKVPIVFCVGQVQDKPVVVTDAAGRQEIAIGPVLPLCCTIDHRVVDGAQIGRLAKYLFGALRHPREVLGDPTEARVPGLGALAADAAPAPAGDPPAAAQPHTAAGATHGSAAPG